MSGFSAEWLELREPFDAAARAAALVAELCAHLAPRPSSAPLEILDLGAGAGSNLRYLAPLIGGAQRWRLADHDPRLLDAALAATHRWAEERGAKVWRRASVLEIAATELTCLVECEPVDLAELDAVDLPERGLVTAAALLDLVSSAWLETLVQRCRTAGAAVFFALTYDGRTSMTPAEPEDAAALELFNRHQLTDKGFGPALGPNAAGAARAALEARGYAVAAATSDWLIGPGAPAMQLSLLDGWLAAARELEPSHHALDAWHDRRRAHVAAGRSELRVGHVDLVGWL